MGTRDHMQDWSLLGKPGAGSTAMHIDKKTQHKPSRRSCEQSSPVL
jgi:hypothetical protein